MRRIELDEFYEFDKQISEELKNNEIMENSQHTQPNNTEAQKLNKKVTGAFFKGVTLEELTDRMIDYFLPQYPRFLKYFFVTQKLGDYADETFGIGGGIYELNNNIPDLLERYDGMRKDSFFIVASGRKMKINEVAMDRFIEKLRILQNK